MAKQKKNEEKKYKYIMNVICKECGTIVEVPGPCSKCKNEVFERVYLIQEVK